jgi:hypothetical protein
VRRHPERARSARFQRACELPIRRRGSKCAGSVLEGLDFEKVNAELGEGRKTLFANPATRPPARCARKIQPDGLASPSVYFHGLVHVDGRELGSYSEPCAIERWASSSSRGRVCHAAEVKLM